MIRDVICDRNYRQGISVISAENLLVERCLLKGTAGTPPAAGIDFEPNSANERLVNCVMRDCTIENNQGYALHIYAPNLDSTSQPLSIRIENCVTRGTNARSASIVVSSGPKGPVTGLIELINCRFEDVGTTAITIASTTPRGVRLRMVDCTLADPAEESKVAAPILLQTRPDSLEPLGGIEFAGVTIRERIDRPLIKYDDPAGVSLVDVSGSITVERDGQRHEFRLDEPTLAKLIPMDQATRIPRWPLNKTPLAVAQPSTFAGGKLPAHRLRGEALYLIPARQGENVVLRLASQAVGRASGSPVPVQIVGPSGQPVKRFSVEFLQEAEADFTAAETGVYRVECQPDGHTVRMASSSHAALIAADSGPIHLLNTSGEFYFLVPAGVPQFAVRFWGSGDLERVSAAVFDPSGIAGLEAGLTSPPRSRTNSNARTRNATRCGDWRSAVPVSACWKIITSSCAASPRCSDSARTVSWPRPRLKRPSVSNGHITPERASHARHKTNLCPLCLLWLVLYPNHAANGLSETSSLTYSVTTSHHGPRVRMSVESSASTDHPCCSRRGAL